MNYLRNPEIKTELMLHLAISISGILGMFLLCGSFAALGTAVICIAFLVLYFLKNVIRYHRTALMGDQIDRILHGEDISVLQDCMEGDIAVLATQINKMVRQLKDQSDHLKRDKILMADSMADISHQIKTPLTSIRLILSFLQEDDLPKARRLELSKELSQLTNRIEWLIYALLRMAKLEAGTIIFNKENILVADLWKCAYTTLAIPLELRGIQCHFQAEESVSMFGDMAWMVEAIENILKNCMEQTPEGGEITISAAENPIYTSIRIEDTGPGIAEEDLPHIFERFYRGKNAEIQSVGIGLALSRKIISAHDGIIKAGNRKDGAGAFFEIRFYKTVL